MIRRLRSRAPRRHRSFSRGVACAGHRFANGPGSTPRLVSVERRQPPRGRHPSRWKLATGRAELRSGLPSAGESSREPAGSLESLPELAREDRSFNQSRGGLPVRSKLRNLECQAHAAACPQPERVRGNRRVPSSHCPSLRGRIEVSTWREPGEARLTEQVRTRWDGPGPIPAYRSRPSQKERRQFSSRRPRST